MKLRKWEQVSKMNQEEFAKKHREYSIYANWPPFSISSKKRNEYLEDVANEDRRIVAKINADDADAFDRMYSTLEVKWQDDLEEARLYQKRYGEEKIDAFLAALKIEGLEEDSDGVPFGIF
jgi:hypothetical protein